MDSSEIEARRRAAQVIVREAGELAAGYFGRRDSLRIEEKGRQDFVSLADKATEELIVAALSKAFPGDSFLGEETGRREGGPMMWVIDPIDGTANFLAGIPHWCVSVGLLSGGRPALGFLFNPVSGDMFSATAGGGARLNERPISVSRAAELQRARIELGFSFREEIAPHAHDVRDLLGAGCDYLRLGSGALGLAYVAAGRLDGYFERHINLWDVAAGLVIVSEAGGRLNDFLAGAAMTEGNEILASTPALYDPLRRLFDRT